MTVFEWVKAAHEPRFYKNPAGVRQWEDNVRTTRTFYKLIQEELVELSLPLAILHKWQAINAAQWTAAKVAIVDALGDIMWLCMTMLVCMGIDWQAVIERIAESNATKLLDGEVWPDKDGKIRKGAHYVLPKLDDLV